MTLATIRTAHSPIPVVILHHDERAGREAMQMLDNLSHLLRAGTEFHRCLWHLDLLTEKQCRGFIAVDVTGAEIVVLAPDPSRLSGGVEDWLVTCLGLRDGEPPLVIALTALNGAAESALSVEKWNDLRRRFGGEFFVTDVFAHDLLDARTPPAVPPREEKSVLELTRAAKQMLRRECQLMPSEPSAGVII